MHNPAPKANPLRSPFIRLFATFLTLALCATPNFEGASAQAEADQLVPVPEMPAPPSPMPSPASEADITPQEILPPDLNTSEPVTAATGTIPQDITAEASQLPQTTKLEPATPLDTALKFLTDGGPSIWAIAALAVITLALILWKIWRLALAGAWSTGKATKAVNAFETGDIDGAKAIVLGRIGIRSQIVSAALVAQHSLPEDKAREETARVAKKHIAKAGTGLGALELIATIAPLLGLLGTVLGMIAAFQALEQAGAKADPSLLAGGIWEALLTTAAGMAVAIPASAALTWFEAVINRIRRDVEDAATRIFVAARPAGLKIAAE